MARRCLIETYVTQAVPVNYDIAFAPGRPVHDYAIRAQVPDCVVSDQCILHALDDNTRLRIDRQGPVSAIDRIVLDRQVPNERTIGGAGYVSARVSCV